MKQVKFTRLTLLILPAFLISSFVLQESLASQEIIRTPDGRTIQLNADGTHEFLTAPRVAWQDFLEERPPLFRKEHRDYFDKIDYMPTFRNISGKQIVGVEFITEFQNAFGNTITKLKGTIEERINHGAVSQATIFYTFKNNEFIDGETYDKLLPLVVQGTGKQVLTVKAIAFADGKIQRFAESEKATPRPLSGWSTEPEYYSSPIISNDGYATNFHNPPKSQSEAIQLTEESEVKTSDLLPVIRKGTKAQMKQLRRQYVGGKVYWVGWVAGDTQGPAGRYTIKVDLDDPNGSFTVYDVNLKVDFDTAISLENGEYVFFTGRIKSIDRVFRSPLINIYDGEIIPMSELEH